MSEEAVELFETDPPIQKAVGVALPNTVQDLINARKTKSKMTLNDQIESIHMSLWEEPAYKRYLDAVYSEQAVEGDLFVDDIEAARMIRAYAKEKGVTYVREQKLATIRKSLLVVLRRFGTTRRERREA